jgi:hypothetical protein
MSEGHKKEKAMGSYGTKSLHQFPLALNSRCLYVPACAIQQLYFVVNVLSTSLLLLLLLFFYIGSFVYKKILCVSCRRRSVRLIESTFSRF